MTEGIGNKLSEDEIIERLCIHDMEIINTIYETCFELVESGHTRSVQLDSKGSSLLGMSGLSATIVFSFGGFLIDKIKNIPLPLIGCPIPMLALLYFTSSLTLLVSLYFAYESVHTRSDFRGLHDEDIFHPQMIKGGINPYKRYMAVHAWKVYKNNYKVNEEKGTNQKKAYKYFIYALVQLLPIIIIIALYAYTKGGS